MSLTPAAILGDLRGGLRSLTASPVHSAIAVLTIALGIGLTTTMFAVVQAVLLRPLPYAQPDALVVINGDLPGLGLTAVGLSVPEMDDLAARGDLFTAVTPVWVFDANLTGGERPERVVMVASGPEYFTLLGATPQIGRVFGPEDTAEGFAPSVVLSDGAWRRLFGGDRGVLGRQVRIDSDLYSVVGVMPPGFHHPTAPPAPNIDAWATAGFRADPFQSPPSRRSRFLPSGLARLRPGVTVEAARAAMGGFVTTTLADHAVDYPPDGRWTIRLDRLDEVVLGNVRPLLSAFSAAGALILLIGCANVANLLLARASTREREVAIRLALGAGRRRLLQQLLTEHLVLAAVGGLAGVLVVWWSEPLLLAAVPADLPRLHEIHVDGRGVAFALALTVVTSLACGIAPALQASHTRPAAAIADVGRAHTGGRRQRRFRTALVVAEIALAIVLVAGAGLLVTTVSRLLAVDAGFDPSRVTVARMWIAVPNNPALDTYRTAGARANLVRLLLERLRGIPDVDAAAIASVVPLTQAPALAPLTIDGRVADAEAATAELVAVSPDYFSLLDVPVRRGRVFRDSDGPGAAPVVMIDEEAERRFFPGLDAVGRELRLGRPGPNGTPPAMTIIGVVKTVRQTRLDEAPVPHVYASVLQRPGRGLGVLVKTRTPGAHVADALRAAVRSADTELPVFGLETLDDTVGRSISRQRFSARAVAAFALAALLLVAGGVYGVMAYAVATRTQEIGVRLAMGATPAVVLRGVLRDALQVSTTGVVCGLALAAVLTRFMTAMLFGVSAADPRVFAVAAAVLTATAIAASYLPARRAARVDPMVSLRTN
ncbi:MAG: ABC transporter permease [Vicinamibacterales bacterium]